MHLLLTRPAEDAQATAAALESRGHRVLIEPMLEIRPLPDAPLDLAGAQALLLTSANGARALSGRPMPPEMPVFAVGDATARAAAAAGFTRIASAGGDVGDLARLVIARLGPTDGALVHVAGSAVAGDLAGALAARGFDVRRAVLYAAAPAAALSPACVAALAGDALDGALFFSPRSGRAFARLARKAGCEESCRRLTGWFLSEAVAMACDLPWRACRIAAEPTQAALIAAIDATEEGG